MAVPYAEVIGDPIAQSKSPLIHRRWLEQLGLPGDYRATRVAREELGTYLAERRQDPSWRGCNVTIPHKERVLPLLDRLDPGTREIGAANCIVPGPEGLAGRNTDIDGVAAALDGAEVRGRKAVLIGAGGSARAAFRYLTACRAATVAIVVRNPGKAAHFARQGTGTRVELHAMEACESAFEGAATVINASPLGMEGSPLMPPHLLDCVAAHARGAVFLDMVYKPLRTDFLRSAEANGGIAVDGLVMLIGQARAAFELFFGHPAPAADGALRDLLTT
jgi:shikimate dehydrogenase